MTIKCRKGIIKIAESLDKMRLFSLDKTTLNYFGTEVSSCTVVHINAEVITCVLALHYLRASSCNPDTCRKYVHVDVEKTRYS